jgi:hypothetical protein
MCERELDIKLRVKTTCRTARANKAPKLKLNMVKNALPMDSLKNDHWKIFPARINAKHIRSNQTKNRINFNARFCIFFKWLIRVPFRQ